LHYSREVARTLGNRVDGRDPMIRTVWLIRTGEDVPRFGVGVSVHFFRSWAAGRGAGLTASLTGRAFEVRIGRQRTGGKVLENPLEAQPRRQDLRFPGDGHIPVADAVAAAAAIKETAIALQQPALVAENAVSPQ
jgi:hypothetical protein